MLSPVHFETPKKLTPEIYLQIHAKKYETLRHDLWKAQHEKKGDFAAMLEKVNAEFETVSHESYNLIMEEASQSPVFTDETMKRAFVTFAVN